MSSTYGLRLYEALFEIVWAACVLGTGDHLEGTDRYPVKEVVPQIPDLIRKPLNQASVYLT